MVNNEVVERMRRDWDARALEDAKFFINFRRRDQADSEFNDSAPDIVARIRREYPLLAGVPQEQRRFLEIGSGVGRLMAPLAGDCAEIHGIDVSAEMVRLGRQRLANLPNVHFHQSFGSEMPQFQAGSFDLVYSFAVFQHIPDREIIFGYLRGLLES